MISLKPIQRIEFVTPDLFFKSFKQTETPVVIEKLTQSWPAHQKWTFHYLKQLLGDNIVPLYNSQPSVDRKHQYAPAETMPLKNYLELLEQGENNLRLFFYNLLAEAPELCQDFSYPDIGLSFFKRLPVLFIGGKGAKVQMHFDIDLADILLCHFGGKKKVMLFSPEQTPLMYKVPFSFSSLFDINYEQPNYHQYPGLKYLHGQVTELNHGDVLYIPPGWWHYIAYKEIGFSMALRALPRQPKHVLKALRNLIWTKMVEGMMRRVIGQRWNDRNEQLAVKKTNRYLHLQNLR